MFSTLLPLILFMMLAFSNCDKKPPLKEDEENLRISTDAVNNAEVLGSDYNFNLTIESVMPPSGVKITVNVLGESDNRNYSPVPDLETMNKVNPVRLHDLPPQIYVLCTINVISKTKSTNKATRTFRIIRK